MSLPDDRFRTAWQARLEAAIEAQRAELVPLRTEMQALNGHTYSRVERLDRALAEMEADRERRRDEMDKHLTDIDLALARFSERQTLWAGAQAVFATVAAVIAAIVRRP